MTKIFEQINEKIAGSQSTAEQERIEYLMEVAQKSTQFGLGNWANEETAQPRDVVRF